MITPDEITRLIQSEITDAEVAVIDKTGMSDHYIIHVVSDAFQPLGLMDRHRLVMATLKPALNDGRLHAAEIQTALP